MFENVDRVLQKKIDDGVPGIDILIYKDGREVFRSVKGFSDRENKIQMNGTEKYNMYSCSKPITATATMQLVENKLITLETPLYSVMPEFKNMYVKQDDGLVKADNYITIKHLLTMTAGFSYDLESEAFQEAKKATNGECPTVETIKYLSQEALLFEPGTKWNYSLCHDILAAVVEVVGNMRFGEYVKKHIFKPLGMNNSTFLLPDSQIETVSVQYEATPQGIERRGKEIRNFKLGSQFESGGAGLISTVEDYMKFLEALRTGTIVSKATVDLMQTDTLDGIDSSLYWPAKIGYGYGLGVRCAKTPNDMQISDFGWGGAAGSYLAIDRTNNISLFCGMHVLDVAELLIMKELKKDLCNM